MEIPGPSLPSIVNFNDDELHKACFSSFEHMRRKGKLCDVTLISDSCRFSAHKIVLAATIPFFNGMFLSNMSESNKSEISMLGLDSCALEAFIGFAYTGSIQITPCNVQSLLIGASFLQLSSIRDICCKYIEERLSPGTVLTVRNFAQSFMCTNLAASCDNYIYDHFDAVSKTDTFLTIDGNELLALLESDDLSVASEENLFQVIMDWVEHEESVTTKGEVEGVDPTAQPLITPSASTAGPANVPVNVSVCSSAQPEKSDGLSHTGSSPWSSCRPLSFSDPCLPFTEGPFLPHRQQKSVESRVALLPELLKRIRLPLIPASYIATVISKHRLIRENIYCRDLLDEVRDMLLLRDRAACSFSCRPRRGQEVFGIIYAVGGLTANGDCHGIVETYHPSLGRWEMAEHMPSQRSRIGVVALNGRLYAIGGYDGNSRLDTTEVYDPRTKTWSTVAPMNCKRSALGAAALDGRIYVCGGYDGVSSLRTCEVYNPQQNKWHLIPSMTEPRSAGGLVALSNGCLYAVGGHNGLAIYSSVECYNRRGGGPAVGGIGGSQIPNSNGPDIQSLGLNHRSSFTTAWHPVARMIHRRCRHGVTALRNRIIVAGGYNGVTFLRSVEVFDPATGPDQNGLMGQWTVISSLGVPRSRVGLAVTGGRLYAIGGYDGTNHLRTVECFHPPANYPDTESSVNSEVAETDKSICVDPPASQRRMTSHDSSSMVESNHCDSSDEENSQRSVSSTGSRAPSRLEEIAPSRMESGCSNGRPGSSTARSQVPFYNWRWVSAAPLIAHEGWVGVGVLPLDDMPTVTAQPPVKTISSAPNYLTQRSDTYRSASSSSGSNALQSVAQPTRIQST
ncbi:unnamed protein product [Calicophoron daubneyi]|uniref:BTB domain-containing protein n=1 Tax=Calicophoron daubneyi TaxID=300641 RepID=A0AAV2TWW6_CALDB